MKYIFYYIWIGLAMIHPWFSKIFIPMNWLIMKLCKKTEKDYQKWKKNYNKAILEFPGGINDWFAFAFFTGIFLFTVIGFTLKFNIDIYTNKYYFGSIAVVIGGFCYYRIYFRNIEWLKKRINKVSKKYYIK